MLILTRKINESVFIGNNIIVRVIDIKGGQIRMGIEAPRDVSVHREEIYRKINNGKTICIEHSKPSRHGA